nr:hypothetical protein [Lachnospiraceae bacterium]
VMDKLHYDEMLENLNRLEQADVFMDKIVYLFGHCNATEELADLLVERGYVVCAILDNNKAKQGTEYKGIKIKSPASILEKRDDRSIVCIVARAYASMYRQLRQIGYQGKIEKLVDYNTYAEYSLSDETIQKKKRRLEEGMELLLKAKEKYHGVFRIYCPFQALGDICFMMSFLPYFLGQREIKDYVVFTIGETCAEVARIYGAENTEVLTQKEMDEQIQAVLYTRDENAFIPHQDRPYVQTLYKALYIKKISLEDIYKYGVFALSKDCVPYRPVNLEVYDKLESIPKETSVILSPYAKSVTNIPEGYWNRIRDYYKREGYMVYANVAGDEEALSGSIRLEIPLAQFQSVVERAGTFIGVRSGLCDVIRWADCKKTVLYPNCFYSDTRWKMEEIYHLEGWNNVVITPEIDIISEIVTKT